MLWSVIVFNVVLPEVTSSESCKIKRAWLLPRLPAFVQHFGGWPKGTPSVVRLAWIKLQSSLGCKRLWHFPVPITKRNNVVTTKAGDHSLWECNSWEWSQVVLYWLCQLTQHWIICFAIGMCVLTVLSKTAHNANSQRLDGRSLGRRIASARPPWLFVSPYVHMCWCYHMWYWHSSAQQWVLCSDPDWPLCKYKARPSWFTGTRICF